MGFWVGIPPLSLFCPALESHPVPDYSGIPAEGYYIEKNICYLPAGHLMSNAENCELPRRDVNLHEHTWKIEILDDQLLT